jgi:hypothetical protein
VEYSASHAARETDNLNVENRRRRIGTLVCLCLLLGLGLWLLARGERRADVTPSARDEVALLEQRLSDELARSSAASVSEAWIVMRALGPRATPAVREGVRGGARVAAASDAMPRWAGTEPSLALGATLLEAGEAEQQDQSELNLALARQPSNDPFTQAWRIEYLALSLRALRAQVRTIDVARAIHAGGKLLERGVDPASLEYAWLAQALFRAGAIARDERQRADLQRCFARLSAAPRDPDESLLLVATRLEALASYALFMRTSGPVHPSLRASIEAARKALATLVARPSLDEASSSLRALRLSGAALGDTNSVFTQ